MAQTLFELFVTRTGASKFVQDWIRTEASLWGDVQVTIKKRGERCSIFILAPEAEHNTYVREKLFGKSGELTKKFWLAIFHET